MKKLLSIILVAAIMICTIPMGAFTLTASAATSGANGDCTWSLDGTVLTISGNGEWKRPSSAPWPKSKITDIIINDGVTGIGQASFHGYTNLKNVTIGNDVTYIDWYAFEECTSLTNVTIGNKVNRIYTDAFAWCGNIENLYITDIFAWCKISFDSNNSRPRAMNLYLNNELVSDLVIPSDITNISEYNFSGFKSIKTVKIPSSVTSIGFGAFEDCTGLTSVTIPDSVTSIDSYAFQGCTSLASIIIPNSITSIGDWAFHNCTSLTSIAIPDSVISIGKAAFLGCTSLTSISVDEDNENYCSIDGVLFSKGKGELKTYPSGKSNTSYIIPDSVTSIDSHAFYGCDNLTGITIPNCVKRIYGFAFGSCDSLTSIIIGKGVTYIASYAFNACDSIKEVWYTGSEHEKQNIDLSSDGNDVIINAAWHYNTCSNDGHTYYVCNEKCKNCDWKISVDVDHAFDGGFDKICNICGDERTVIGNTFTSGGFTFLINDDETLTAISYDLSYGCDFSIPTESNGLKVTTIGESFLKNVSEDINIVVPDSILTIKSGAFVGSDNLVIVCTQNSTAHTYATQKKITTLLTAGTVGEDGYWSLDFSTGILTIETLENGYTTKSPAPWYEYRKYIKQIYFANEIFDIGYYAFYDCYNLKEVTIPKTVTTIGEAAFLGCSSLVTVNVLGDAKFGHSCFANCVSLKNINIPFGINSIGGSEVFLNCVSLENIFIPTNITEISETVFSGCDNLVLMVINASVAHQFAVENNIPHTLFIGEGIDYSFDADTGVLTINGQGEMYDFKAPEQAPWYEYKDSIKTIEISEGIVHIGSNAFVGCTKIKSFDIPDNIESIGARAFSSCSSLLDITVGDGIKSIGANAFDGCTRLKRIYINDLANWCGVEFGSNANPLSNGGILYIDGNVTNDIIIPDGVTAVAPNAFIGCVNIKNVTIPEGVTTIGESAFWGCSALTTVSIPSTVQTIGKQAFNLCQKLKNVYISDLSSWLSIGFENYNANPLYIAENLYIDGELTSDLIIPDGTTEIAPMAFYDFQGFDYVYVPASVTTVGEDAFYFCDFETVEFAEGTELILSDTLPAFCSMGAHIIIPDSVLFIETDTISGTSTQIFGMTGSESENYAIENECQFYKTPVSIEVVQLPDRTTYYKESKNASDYFFSTTGLKIKATYYDGTSEILEDGFKILDRDYPYIQEMATGTHHVKVWFGGKTTSFDIAVYAKELTSIAVTEKPVKTEYILGEEFSHQGMTVTAYYKDGTSEHLQITDDMISGFDSVAVGTKTITITFAGKTDTFNVSVVLHFESEHVYDNNCDTTCDECGAIRTVPDHVYDNTCDTTCSECGTVRDITHKYTNACDAECNVCGEIRQVPNHVYTNGCDTTCNECDYTRHTSHIYDDDFDATCNECGVERDAKKYGDTNFDDSINNRDLCLLMQYINGWNVEINTDAADVNGDGKVNNKDYVLLMRYINGWNVELQ